MTKEDWEYYYECRKKYDAPMTLEKASALVSIQARMSKEGYSDQEVIQFVIDNHIPIVPKVALNMKNTLGFKAIQELNLYAAKKFFPGEFE